MLFDLKTQNTWDLIMPSRYIVGRRGVVQLVGPDPWYRLNKFILT